MSPASSALPADSRVQGSGRHWILLALLVGLALRVWEAWESSIWLDEAHSLFHASQPSFSAVLDTVQRDFHAPLFFLFLHACGDFASGAWLRWIPIAASLLALVPVFALARESVREGDTRTWAALVTAWLFATLPYQVHYGAELRPYAWIELLSASAAWSAFSERGSRRARLALFFASILLGTLTHRVMVIVVASIGAARLFVRGPKLVGLPSLIIAGTLAVLPAVAWVVKFASWATDKRVAFEEIVGERVLRPQLVLEVRDLPARLVAPYLGSLGRPWSLGAQVGFALFALSLVALAVGRWRGRDRAPPGESTPVLRAVLIFGAVQFALITASSLWFWDRAPLQYYVGMSWVIPLALGCWIALLRPESVRRAVAIALVAASTLLGAALAGGESRESFDRAVELARRWGSELSAADPRPQSAPFYTALLSQPGGVFENVLPYRVYAADLDAVEPEALPGPGSPGFSRHVIVIRRALNLEHPRWQALLAGRRIVREERLHERIWVYELASAAN